MRKYLFLLLLLFQFPLLAQQDREAVLVVSGGGARGAWGGGVAQQLVREQGKDYATVVGTSTGSLLAPFILLKDFEDLRRFYTTVEQRDIFSLNPFRKNGQLKTLNLVFRVLFGAKTLGKSKNLRKLIDRSLPLDVYERVLDSGNVIVTVVNFNNSKIKYFSNRDFDSRGQELAGLKGGKHKKALKQKEAQREQFLNWMWASANQPVVMSLYETRDEQGEKQFWVDGGIRENVAIIRGLEELLALPEGSAPDSATLDVIVNNTIKPQLDEIRRPRIVSSLFHTINILSFDTRANDTRIPADITLQMEDMAAVLNYLERCEPEPDDQIITINLYYMKQTTLDISPESLLFEPEKMSKLWDAGTNYRNSASVLTYQISRSYGRALVQAFKETH